MEAFARTFGKGHQVVVATVTSMGEGNHVLGAVGEFQTQRLLIKSDRPRYIGGKQQHMGQALRPDLAHRVPAAHAPQRTHAFGCFATAIGHRLGPSLDLQQVAVRIMKPEAGAVTLFKGRPATHHLLAQRIEVGLEAIETDPCQ
ncbi:hypothetical protein D9M71_640840 [compost metagenome]